MKNFVSLIALVLFGAACGSGGLSSTSGTINGKSIAAMSNAAFFTDNSNDISKSSELAFIATNITDNICSFIQSEGSSGTNTGSSSSYSILELVIGKNSGQTTGLSTGAYTVFNAYTGAGLDSNVAAFGTAIFADSSGNSGLGVGGTITVTTLTNTDIAGSYDIDFASASDPNTKTGTLSGNFSGSHCTVPNQ